MPKQDESQELDLTVYTDKPASPLQQHFAEWIPGVTGYEPNSAKSKTAAFQMGVKLALNTHKFFQKSEDNKSRNAELMEQRAAERAEREALKEQKAAERAEKEAEASASARSAKLRRRLVRPRRRRRLRSVKLRRPSRARLRPPRLRRRRQPPASPPRRSLRPRSCRLVPPRRLCRPRSRLLPSDRPPVRGRGTPIP
jgi:hypothetical protein